MKDRNGISLTRGDLIVMRIDEFLDINDMRVVFDSVDSNNRMKYYPLTSVGVGLIKYESGETQVGFFRKEPYYIDYVDAHQLTLMDPGLLNSTERLFYNQIVQRLV